MSAFRTGTYGEVGKSHKLSVFPVGEKLIHEYDFGTTTETLITVVAEINRPKQKDAVRLLARNMPPKYECSKLFMLLIPR